MFNFGTPTTSATGFNLASTSTPTLPSFGTPKAPTPSLFPTAANTTTPTLSLGTPAGGFNLGGGANTTPATGLQSTGFTLGGTPTLGGGTSGIGNAGDGAFRLNKTPTIGTTAPPSFNLSSGFGTGSLGTTTTTTTPQVSTLNFASPQVSVAPQFNLGASLTPSTTTITTATSTPAPSTGFGASLLGSGPQQTQLSLATSTVSSTKASTATTTPAPSIVSVTQAAPTIGTLGTGIATTGGTSGKIGALPILGGSTPVAPPGMTYAQLGESINKWTVDLEEQGKFFINQARELNAWDSLLISNGNKLLKLTDTMKRVKNQQEQLDQELDFILSQQNDLDELIKPLEKQLAELPITDQSRFQTYQLSEIIDSQLKQMSEDLKEIVEHLNESNNDEDISDPVVQVSRILNAHMNSLQWIDKNTSQITAELQRIAKIQDNYKKGPIGF